MTDVQDREVAGTRPRLDRRPVAAIGDALVDLLATTALLILLAAAFGIERLFAQGTPRVRTDDAHEG